MAPATWHGTRSLATECYEAADGDFEIALLLALDYLHKFRVPGPSASLPVAPPVQSEAATGSLTERETA